MRLLKWDTLYITFSVIKLLNFCTILNCYTVLYRRDIGISHLLSFSKFKSKGRAFYYMLISFLLRRNWTLLRSSDVVVAYCSWISEFNKELLNVFLSQWLISYYGIMLYLKKYLSNIEKYNYYILFDEV